MEKVMTYIMHSYKAVDLYNTHLKDVADLFNAFLQIADLKYVLLKVANL